MSLPEGWRETTLGELVELAQGVAINKKTNHVLCEKSEGLPLLKINNLVNNTVDQYANPNLVPQKAILEFDDIVFTRTGQVGWVFTKKVGILHNNSFKVIPSNKLDKKFLYWFLKKNSIYNYVQKVASGSAQPDLNHDAFKTITIKYPIEIDEQKAIANILSSFDEKIELLKEQNETLEQMAQGVFREWFVDIESIPTDWQVTQLKDISEKISKGTTPRKKDVEGLDATVPFLKVKDITNNGNIKISALEKIPNEVHKKALKRSILEENDLLYSIAGTIGRVAILPKELDNINCNQAVAFIRLKEKNRVLEYVHQWVQTRDIKAKIDSSIVQGVQANVSLGTLGDLEIVIPNDTTLSKWNDFAQPIYEKLRNNTEQIQTLQKTRDTLLPKLMSGERRVSV